MRDGYPGSGDAVGYDTRLTGGAARTGAPGRCDGLGAAGAHRDCRHRPLGRSHRAGRQHENSALGPAAPCRIPPPRSARILSPSSLVLVWIPHLAHSSLRGASGNGRCQGAHHGRVWVSGQPTSNHSCSSAWEQPPSSGPRSSARPPRPWRPLCASVRPPSPSPPPLLSIALMVCMHGVLESGDCGE